MHNNRAQQYTNKQINKRTPNYAKRWTIEREKERNEKSTINLFNFGITWKSRHNRANTSSKWRATWASCKSGCCQLLHTVYWYPVHGSELAVSHALSLSLSISFLLSLNAYTALIGFACALYVFFLPFSPSHSIHIFLVACGSLSTHSHLFVFVIFPFIHFSFVLFSKKNIFLWLFAVAWGESAFVFLIILLSKICWWSE